MNLFEIAFANSQKKILKALQQKTNYIFILVMTLVGSFFNFFGWEILDTTLRGI